MIIHLFHSTIVSGPETLALPALARLGEPVRVIFLEETRVEGGAQGPVAYARSLGHPVDTVPVRARWDRGAFRELRDLLDRLGPRVVHAHDVKASLYLMMAARVRPGFKPKLVSTHHGAAARKGLIRLYEQLYVRWVLPRFDAALCVCRGDRASLLRRGVPADRLSIHYNGVDRPYVAPAARAAEQARIRAAWRERMPGLPTDARLVGAVARLSQEKRHDRMIRALQAAKFAYPQQRVALVFFGTGPEEAGIRALVAELGLQADVFVMGYSKTIGQEMAGFDLLLCLSDGEGIPINLIEAGWTGTPVFSTSVGGIPDLIDSEEVGYLVEKAESDEAIGRRLGAALADEAGLHARGLAFQKRVLEQFSEKSWLDELRRIYAGLGGA